MKKPFLKIKYQIIANKYNLPSLKEIEEEIGFKVELKANAIVDVRTCLTKYIQFVSSYLERILWPQTAESIFESTLLEQKDKTNILKDYFIPILILEKKLCKTVFQGKKENIMIIKELYDSVKNFKPKGVELIELIIKSLEGFNYKHKENGNLNI